MQSALYTYYDNLMEHLVESGCVFIELYQFTNHSMANYLEFEYLVVSLLTLGFLIQQSFISIHWHCLAFPIYKVIFVVIKSVALKCSEYHV